MKAKGDGMERLARNYYGGYEGTMMYAMQVYKLTRLLRKVAREAVKRGRKAGHEDVAVCAARRKRELSA